MHVPLLTVDAISENMRTVGCQKLDSYVAADSSPIAILPMPPSWPPNTHQYQGHIKEKMSDIPYICNCNAATLQLHRREILLYVANNKILHCRLGSVKVVENDVERHWKRTSWNWEERFEKRQIGMGGKVGEPGNISDNTWIGSCDLEQLFTTNFCIFWLLAVCSYRLQVASYRLLALYNKSYL